ncbi:hypothetical protein Tco_1409426 [Tanacetum coccineum]
MVMALVLRHGGDAGGNDQPSGPSRRPPRGGCQGSGGGKKGRGKTTLIAFRKMWEDNHKKLLPIDFDSHDGETWKPVGTYAHQFTTTISLKIGDGNKIPFYFDTWAKVEDRLKTGIWPEIQTQYVENVTGTTNTDSSGMNLSKKMVTSILMLRAKPPGKMPLDEWNRHIDFFLQPDQIKKSETNSKNRSKQPNPSVQGTRTNAASRYSRRKIGADGNPDEYPSLVSDFGLNHISKATGTYVNEAAATKHINTLSAAKVCLVAVKTKELQDALKSSQESGENVPEKEVMKKVLGIRSGHTRGVGRKLKGVSSSSSATSSSSSYYGGSKAYTQDEVNNLIETEGKKLGKKIGKRIASSFNKKLENLLTQLAKKGIPLDKTLVVGKKDEEYEESDDEEMEVLDEDEETNDGDDSVE